MDGWLLRKPACRVVDSSRSLRTLQHACDNAPIGPVAGLFQHVTPAAYSSSLAALRRRRMVPRNNTNSGIDSPRQMQGWRGAKFPTAAELLVTQTPVPISDSLVAQTFPNWHDNRRYCTALAMTTSSAAPSGDLTHQVLQTLSKQSPLLTAEVFPNATFEDIKAAITRLANRSMVNFQTIEREEVLLEPEAEKIAAHGSHEARVFEAVRQSMEGLSIPDLEKAIGDKTVTNLGKGKAFKEKWISKGEDGKLTAIVGSILSQNMIAPSSLTPPSPLQLDRVDPGHNAGSAAEDPKRQDGRCEDAHRAEEAQADSLPEDHYFQG